MIIFRFTDGLGNQLYQFALYLALKKKYPAQIIKADISWYKYDNEHGYGFILDKFLNIKIPIATNKEIRSVYHGIIYRPYMRRLPKIILSAMRLFVMIRGRLWQKKKLNNYLGQRSFCCYNGNVFYLNDAKDYYISGWWMNMKYIQMVEEEIKETLQSAFKINLLEKFSSEDNVILREIEGSVSICLHIRLGLRTVLPEKIFTLYLCDLNYYKKAIKAMEEKLKENNITKYRYFIFSNDINYCKTEYQFLENAVFVNHTVNQWDIDFYLMSKCKHAIIPNSSFSFWSVYMTDNANKTVVYPKYFYRDIDNWNEFSTPDHWIAIDNLEYES
jgi:hypothetical protein